jgi:hypothetical protein
MIKPVQLSITALCLLAGLSASANAQTVRIGAAVVIASGDGDSRVKNPDSTDQASVIRLPVHAAVYVAPRIGFGVEAMTFGRLTGSISKTMTFDITEEEQESVIVGTVHARVLEQPRFGIEAVGGAGALRLERTTRTTFRFPDGSAVKINKSNYPAFMAGLDAPFRLDRHFTVGPTVRVYWLRRDEAQTSVVHSSPSTRVMAGLSASVAW